MKISKQMAVYLRAQQRSYEAQQKGRRARKQARAPILTGEAKKHAVAKIIDLLKDWRYSPFENEATCRNGIRQALCLRGYGWQRSEDEAAAILTDAFKVMGVSRPTWEQGQPDYTTPAENCNWCQRPLGSEAFEGKRQFRFCSVDCAAATFQHRARQDFSSTKKSKLLMSAQRIIAKSRTTARLCAQCSSPFQPISNASEQRFCSMACRGLSARTVPTATCRGCGVSFAAKSGKLYCTTRCYQAGGVTLQLEKQCAWCSTTFVAKSEKAMYCTKAHQQQAYRAQNRRTATIIDITPYLFDREFSRVSMSGGGQGTKHIRGTG